MAAPALVSRRAAAAFLTLAAMPLGALAATGSGRAATESRDPGSFDAIELRGDIDLVARSAPRESLSVSADDNLLPLLETAVQARGERRTLVIQWQPGQTVRTRSRALVTVDAVTLRALSTAGSGDVQVDGLKTPSLSLSIAGSSDARLRALEAGRLQVKIAGSGDVQADGRATRLDVSVAGSGDVSALALEADEVSVAIAGSGDVRVHAARALSVSIAGSGDVEYRGGATPTVSRMGSGSVRQRP